jgi:signal transduction histidine kinase
MAISDVRQALRVPAGSLAGGAPARLGIAGAFVCLAAVTVATAGAPGDEAFERGLLELLVVGVPMAGGMYALRAPATATFGSALLAIGFVWALTAFAESSESVPYTIGRLAAWLTLPSAFFLLLSFPDSRIRPGLDRTLWLGLLAVSVVLFYGTAPLVTAYPAHTPWATCTTQCPHNAVALVSRTPSFMPKVILVREWLVDLLWLAMFVSMLRRLRAASPLQRRALGPVFLIATAIGLCQISYYVARELGGSSQTVVALSWAWTLCIVGMCGAFTFGLFRRRLLLGAALARLGVALRRSDDPAAVRDAVATTLGDATIQLLLRDPITGVWHEAGGGTVRWPRPVGDGRAATAVGADRGDEEVVLIHDIALRGDREVLDAVSGMVLAAWHHERLTGDLAKAMSDLEDSRRRIAETADLERVRIERDLHDGAQQRLVALRIRLGLAEDLLRTDPVAGAREVHELGTEAELVLEELRSLAHGVYPPLLTDQGLSGALAAVARQAPLPVHLIATGLTRHPIEIESAVYFTCVEALQNALKHATTATAVWMRLTQSTSALGFEIRDDGCGFTPDEGSGHGLRNMRDRIEAIGGWLAIEAEPEHGTRVVGSVALTATHAAPAGDP